MLKVYRKYTTIWRGSEKLVQVLTSINTLVADSRASGVYMRAYMCARYKSFYLKEKGHIEKVTEPTGKKNIT